MQHKAYILLAFVLLSKISFASDEIQYKYFADTPKLYSKTTFDYARHPLIPSAHYTIVHKKLEQLTNTIAALYPRPINSMVHPYGGIYAGNSYPLAGTEFKNSPYQVDLFISFLDIIGWNDDDPVTGGESCSITLWLNSIWYILQVRFVHYSNNLIFMAPIKGTDRKTFPTYNGQVLMTMPGKGLPWRPATRKEYLENVIADLKNPGNHTSDKNTANKDLTKAVQILAAMSEAEKKEPAFLEKSQYGGGCVEFFNSMWKGFKIAGDTNAIQLVIADETYFDSKLPKTSVQLIAIGFHTPRSGFRREADIKLMRALLFTPGVLEAMYAMLGK